MKEQKAESVTLENIAKSYREEDKIWNKGQFFGFTYIPDKETSNNAKKVRKLFNGGNTLNPFLFGSVKNLERDIVTEIGELLNAPSGFSGHFTSGGTESIFLALKSANKYFRKRDSANVMEVLLCGTAHPAFLKACDYMNYKVIRVPVNSDYTIQTEQLGNYITPRCGLVVVSAPNYPFGTIDPVEKVAEITRKYNVPLHVDACLGGMIIPFVEEITDREIKFDFRIKGVTSISVDLHKYGYCPKGSSLILYRNSELAACQYYITDDWKGGLYGSTRLLGSTGAEVLAESWATIQLLGKEGYRKMTETVLEGLSEVRKFISEEPRLELLTEPLLPVLTFKCTSINSLLLGDLLEEKGWYMERLPDPDRLHMILNLDNVKKLPEFFRVISEILDSNVNSDPDYVKKIGWTKKIFRHIPDPIISGISDKFSGKKNHNRRYLYGLRGPDVPNGKKEKMIRRMMQNMNKITVR